MTGPGTGSDHIWKNLWSQRPGVLFLDNLLEVCSVNHIAMQYKYLIPQYFAGLVTQQINYN